jgi:hypothetical protein
MSTHSVDKETVNQDRSTGKKILLIVLRMAWLALAALLLALFIAGMGPRVRELSTACTGDGCISLAPSIADATFIQEAGFTLIQLAYFHQTLEVVSALAMLAVAAVIFFGRFDDWFGILVSFTILLLGLNFTVEADNAFIRLHPAWHTPFYFLNFITAILFMLQLYLFPDGRFTPHATRYVAALAFAIGMIDALLLAMGALTNTLNLIGVSFYLACLTLGLGAQIYRYRATSSPVQRQQTKWVLYGLVLFVMSMISYFLLFELLSPQSTRIRVFLNTVGIAILQPMMLIFPLTMMISILRYRLWDIDVVINRTLVYGALTAVLLLLFLASITLLQALFIRLTGQDSQAAIVLSTLLITVLFNPLRSRLQRLIDRRFYRRKYDATRLLERFAQHARDEVDLHTLSAELVGTVQYAVQPNLVSLWLRTDSADRESDRTNR